MGEHGGLGHARGAAGVLEEYRIIQPSLDLGRRGRVGLDQVEEAMNARTGGHLGQGTGLFELFFHQPLEGEAQGIRDIGHDDLLDCGVALDLLEPIHQAAHDHDGLGPAVVELMLQFSGRIGGVGVDRHHTSLEDAIKGDDLLGRIGQHNADPIPLFQPKTVQGGGKAAGLVVQFLIGHLGLNSQAQGQILQNHAHGDILRIALGRCFQGLVQKLIRRLDGLGHFFFVTAIPGFGHGKGLLLGRSSWRVCAEQ